jgi:hypothetical protein
MQEKPNSTSTVPISSVRQLAVTSAGKAACRRHDPVARSQSAFTTPMACA